MIQWTDRMETGVELQDRQHRELVRKVNELAAAMKAGKGREVVGDMLAFLGQYAVEHFRDEERLMKQAGYPGLAKHHAVHEAFKKDFGALVATYEAHPAKFSTAIEVQRRVLDWLRNHICGIDQDAGKYIKAHGG